MKNATRLPFPQWSIDGTSFTPYVLWHLIFYFRLFVWRLLQFWVAGSHASIETSQRLLFSYRCFFFAVLHSRYVQSLLQPLSVIAAFFTATIRTSCRHFLCSGFNVWKEFLEVISQRANPDCLQQLFESEILLKLLFSLVSSSADQWGSVVQS